MIVTARQIREVRAVVGWASPTVAERALLSSGEVLKTENDEGIKALGGLQLGSIRSDFERAGDIFIKTDGEGPRVRLRKGSP